LLNPNASMHQWALVRAKQPRLTQFPVYREHDLGADAGHRLQIVRRRVSVLAERPQPAAVADPRTLSQRRHLLTPARQAGTKVLQFLEVGAVLAP
jgi:hypothetical protein